MWSIFAPLFQVIANLNTANIDGRYKNTRFTMNIDSNESVPNIIYSFGCTIAWPI